MSISLCTEHVRLKSLLADGLADAADVAQSLVAASVTVDSLFETSSRI